MTHKMVKDEPAHVGQVLILKTSVNEMKSWHKATYELLQNLIDRLSPTQALNAHSPM